MGVALLYFLHKVVWFIRLRALQAKLLDGGMRRLERLTDREVEAWKKQTQTTWSRVSAGSDEESPTDFANQRIHEFNELEAKVDAGYSPLHDRFLEQLGSLDPPDAEASRHQVLGVPRRDGSTDEVSLALDFAPVHEPEKPDPKIYTLQRRSRYGLMRRLLVIALGAVDVVYSSRHVARMSQNVEMPAGVIVRRLSLVALILVVVVLDVTFSARRRLIDFVDERFGHLFTFESSGYWQDLLTEQGTTIVALTLWLSLYGLIYVGLYLLLRRQSNAQYRALNQMRDTETETLERIYDEHRDRLLEWGSEFARTLDNATKISVQQASMLVRRAERRLLHRLADRKLISCAEAASAALFSELPEASEGLEDIANSRKHSWRHALWPRAVELAYQVKITQYRASWRDIDSLLQDLRGEHAAPEVAELLWSSLVAYAGMFPEVLPEDTVQRLNRAFEPMAKNLLESTREELKVLDRRLGDLTRALSNTMDTAGDLVANRIELTNQAIHSEVSEYTRKVIATREQARLEAMAFEI